jgi:hypothetical protein
MKSLAGSVGSPASPVNIISNAASPTGDGPDELALAEFSLWHSQFWLCAVRGVGKLVAVWRVLSKSSCPKAIAN